VVFEGWQTGSRDIWMTNIDTLEQEDLVDHPAAQFDPAFDGQWVVWTDGRNDPSPSPYDHRVNPDIYGMEMATRTEEPLCDHPAVQLHPDVHDGLVVWEDFRNAEDPNNGWDSRANIDIYLLDLETRREVQVTNLPGPERGPRVWGRRVFFVAEDLIGQTAVFMVDLDEAGLLAPDGD
jgi:Tol biopolymer transport system component